MCRWMAWFGQPVLIDELLFGTKHGIVDQSLHARMGAEPTNGDGFGLGWYDADDGTPALYRSGVASVVGREPARAGRARHLAAFLVHVRAAIGSPVQQTNCHPFRHGRWLFVHNGYVADFPLLRRDLMLAIDPDRFAAVHGLDRHRGALPARAHPRARGRSGGALARTVGLDRGDRPDRRGCDCMVQASFGVCDGASLWAVRYATEGPPRSLFASADVETVRRLYPDDSRLARLTPGDRLIVSEPFLRPARSLATRSRPTPP